MNAQELVSLVEFEQVNLDSFYYDAFHKWLNENSGVLLMLVGNEIEEVDGLDLREPELAYQRWLCRNYVSYFWDQRVTNAMEGLFISEFARYICKFIEFKQMTIVKVSFKRGL